MTSFIPTPHMSLFDANFVYPCDGFGPYVELTGVVTQVERWEHDIVHGYMVRVSVETERGTFVGFLSYAPLPPEVGFQATIRVYRGEAGWYPDSHIMGWSSPKVAPGKTAWERLLEV